MAIYEVTYTFQDSQGRSSDRLLIADVADEAALLTTCSAMLSALQAISKSGVLKYTYRRVVAVNEAGDADSNLDAGATFTWYSPLTIDPTSKIPDPVEGIKDGQGGIDLTAATVITYYELYTIGPWRLNRNVPTQPTSVKRAVLDI